MTQSQKKDLIMSRKQRRATTLVLGVKGIFFDKEVLSMEKIRSYEEQIASIILSVTERSLIGALNEITFYEKDQVQQLFDRKDLLENEIRRVIIRTLQKLSSPYPILTETELLKPVAQAIVPARTGPFNLAEFYQTRDGLYIHETLSYLFDLATEETINSALERPYVALLLKTAASSKKICEKLPENHLSTLRDIAYFIETQPDGKLGFLFNNDYSKILFVKNENNEVLCVHVNWCDDPTSDEEKWIIWACPEYNDEPHPIGSQIICPGVML